MAIVRFLLVASSFIVLVLLCFKASLCLPSDTYHCSCHLTLLVCITRSQPFHPERRQKPGLHQTDPTSCRQRKPIKRHFVSYIVLGQVLFGRGASPDTLCHHAKARTLKSRMSGREPQFCVPHWPPINRHWLAKTAAELIGSS